MGSEQNPPPDDEQGSLVPAAQNYCAPPTACAPAPKVTTAGTGGGCSVTVTVTVQGCCCGGGGPEPVPVPDDKPPSQNPHGPPDPELPRPIDYQSADTYNAFPLRWEDCRPWDYQQSYQAGFELRDWKGSQGSTYGPFYGFMTAIESSTNNLYRGFGVSKIDTGTTWVKAYTHGRSQWSNWKQATATTLPKTFDLTATAGGGNFTFKFTSIAGSHSGDLWAVVLPSAVTSGSSMDKDDYWDQGALSATKITSTSETIVVKTPKTGRTYFAFLVTTPTGTTPRDKYSDPTVVSGVKYDSY